MGIGNPLLDISAHVGQDMLDKYDVKLNNAILAEEKHLPLYKELVESFEVEYVAGGATQNSIRGAQFMSGVEGLTTMVGCVGKDVFGDQLRAAASKDGVCVEYLVDEEAATGTCAVLVHEHERSLVANLSAANNYKFAHLQTEALQKVVAEASIFYIAGFFLTVSPESIVSIGKHAAEHPEKVLIMNLAAPFVAQFFQEPLQKALYYTDILIGNESEAEAYGKALNLEDCSPAAVAMAIAALPKASGHRHRTVIITQGPDPVVVCEFGKVRTYNVPKIPEAEMVDFNGAGDAFVGGFLARIANGETIQDGVAAGLWSARKVIAASGCAYPESCTYDHAAQLKALGL